MTQKPDVPLDPAAPDAIPAPEGATQVIATDYEIGQDNINYRRRFVFELDIHNVVFSVSAIGVVAFTLLTLMFQNTLDPLFSGLRDFLTSSLDWFFIVVANIFVLLCFALIVLPLGRIRLGGPDATPDYSYRSWFSMLFAAGMGIGLMFYGVAEPLGNFTAAFDGPVVGQDGLRTDWAPLDGAPGDAEGARRLAMAATIFHWALHPWAIYAIVALSLALFSFNKGLLMTLRSIFYPIFGERVWGWPGHLIDILAVFATLFGLSTSLGFGAQQASAGLNFLFGLPATTGAMIFLIIIITGIAIASVVAGMEKGVKLLSEINMVLAFLLLVFIIAVGPTLQITTGFFKNLLAYGEYLPALSNPIGRDDDNFRQGWTAFYWAWWISWSPFVGMFIARVSRGRTVREFLVAVLLMVFTTRISGNLRDRDAHLADLFEDKWNGVFLDPVYFGRYPASLTDRFAEHVVPGDLEEISRPVDFLGVNHYFPSYVEAAGGEAWPFRHAEPPFYFRRTEMNWAIDGSAFYEALMILKHRYRNPPVYVTENGASYGDWVGPSGKAEDGARIFFIRDHLLACHRAIRDGADLRGYFVWTLLDNFEWGYGYTQHFGLVQVDRETMRRRPKASYYWYGDVAKANAVPL